MANINWTDLLKDAGDDFELIPAGDYSLRVNTAKATEYQSGNEGIKVEFLIDGGPHNNRKVWTNLVLSAQKNGEPNPDGIWFFLANLAAFGIKANFFTVQPDASMELLAQLIQGLKVQASIQHTTWNGRERAEVKLPLKAPAGGAIEITSDNPSPFAPDNSASGDVGF